MNPKTPISSLQELMAARKLPLPVYVEEGFGTSFTCTVHAAGVTATGTASTKKNAKHESAKNALAKLMKTSPLRYVETPSPRPINSFRNYVGDLNELATKQPNLQYPDYQMVDASPMGEFYFKCVFWGKETYGKGMNKKDAKQDAACKMLELVKAMSPPPSFGTIVQMELEKNNTSTIDKEQILTLYKNLSLKDEERTSLPNTTTTITIERTVSTGRETIDSLKEILSSHHIDFILQDLQKKPWVICLKIKGTNSHFMASGLTREAATLSVLKEVVDLASLGLLKTDNDLINFD